MGARAPRRRSRWLPPPGAYMYTYVTSSHTYTVCIYSKCVQIRIQMYLYVSHQQAEGAIEPGDYIYTYQMTPQITLHADVYIITTHADMYIKDTYGHTDTMYMYCV